MKMQMLETGTDLGQGWARSLFKDIFKWTVAKILAVLHSNYSMQCGKESKQ